MKTQPFKGDVMSELSAVELIITRGLPGSGKTSWARKFVAEQSEVGRRIVRVNRDDLRRMALPSDYRVPDFASEKLISVIRDAALERFLEAGVSVVVDDTNLRLKYARDLADLAHRLGVGFRVADFTDVSLVTCIARDAARGLDGDVGFVGEAVIRDMHQRYLASGPLDPVTVRATSVEIAPELYVADPSLPSVVLCDLDGTVALMGDRNPYDESCVSGDAPHVAVVDVLQALTGYGAWERMSNHDEVYDVVFLSGRTDGCFADTLVWLHTHVFKDSPHVKLDDIVLHMRKAGDPRPDHEVKLELFNSHIRHHYNVRVVFDDRTSVVRLWRSLGLTCFQVADGAF